MQSAPADQLIEWVLGDDDALSTEAIREVARRTEVAAVPALRRVLASTESPQVRNAVALALSDMKDPLAFELIVALLKDSRTEGVRGTLLYALEPYDCTAILSLLVEFVIDGNFEVSRQAFSLIQSTEGTLDEVTFRTCAENVRRALGMATEERRSLLNELLLLFDDS